MAKMFYSPSTGGFYILDIHGNGIPRDAIEITAARHDELISGQAAGQIIAAGPDGAPILVNPPPPPPPPIPSEVTRAQARLGLIEFGQEINRPNLIDEVDALVANLAAGQMGLTALDVRKIKEAWGASLTVRRNSPALNLLFPALGLNLPEQLDRLFVLAAEQGV